MATPPPPNERKQIRKEAPKKEVRKASRVERMIEARKELRSRIEQPQPESTSMQNPDPGSSVES